MSWPGHPVIKKCFRAGFGSGLEESGVGSKGGAGNGGFPAGVERREGKRGKLMIDRRVYA